MVSLFNIQRTITQPVTEPVSLEEVKEWLTITTGDFDSLLTSLITYERQNVENYCLISLVTSAVSFQSYVSWPFDDEPPIAMMPWVGGFSTIALLDHDGNTLDNIDTAGNLLFFPTTGRFTVNLTTSYEIQAPLKQAILMLIAYRFNNRGDQADQQGIPIDIKNVLNPYKVIWQ